MGDTETPVGGLILTGSSSNPTLVPNGNIVFGGSGANRTVTITPAANQAGAATIAITVSDGELAATDTFALSVVSTPAGFTLSGSPPSQSVAPGGSADYGVTILPTGGFTDPVTLSVSGLPAGATGNFTPNPATATSTLTVTTSAGTPLGTYPLTVTGVSGALTRTATVSLSVATTSPVVVFDAVGPGAAGASAPNAAGLSWSHTVSTTGANRLLTASVTVGKNPDAGLSLAVSYNGVPMIPAGLVHSNNETQGFVQLFYLTAPAPGTHAIQVTLTGGTADLAGGSVSFTGVDPVTPVRNVTTNFGSGPSPNVSVASALGHMVVDALVTGCPGGISSSKTARWIREANCATAGGNGAQSTSPGAASVTMGYTVPPDWWGMIGMDLVAATSTSPDFAMSAAPGSQTVGPGGSTTYGVAITRMGGFGDAVTLSASGLPAGATGSFDINPATSSSTLTVTTDFATPPGTYLLTLTGTSGTLTHSASVTLVVSAPANFTLSASPASQSVAPGGSADYGVTILPTGGFTDPVTLSVSGLPAGATGNFTPNPATATSTLTVTTSAGTPLGTYPLTVTGVSGALTRTATVSLSVATTSPVVVFDAVGPGAAGASAPNAAGLSWSHTVSTTGANRLLTASVTVGKNPDAGLSLAVWYNGVPMIPAGLVHSNNETQGFVQLFYLTAPAPGTHAIQVTLTGGTADLAGGSVSFTGVDPVTPVRNVTTNFGSGPSPNVSVASALGHMVVDALVTGCPGGISSSKTARWIREANCATAGGNGAQSTSPGAASVTMGYTVPPDWWGMIGMDLVAAAPSPSPDFAIVGSPASRTVVQGSPTTYGVAITPTGGFAGAVMLSASGLPAGATGSFDINPATSSSTLTVTTGASTPAGTYPLTITGVSGTLTRTASVTLVVNAPADFSLSGSPASRTVAQGSPTTYGVTITPTGGFGEAVMLSASGLPAGATGNFTPNPATATSTLTVTTGASTPAGTYPLTITGVSGTLTRTASVTLVVNAPADFAERVAGEPDRRAGEPTTYGSLITPTGGFGEAVMLSASGLPAGATGSFDINPATSSSTLTVTTGASTPAGTYPLTITGVSGTLTRTASVTLVVNAPADFLLSGSPASRRTVAPGSPTTYRVAITPTGGFEEAVTLSASGLPAGATGSFDINPATSSSTLTGDHRRQHPGGDLSADNPPASAAA